MRRSRAYILTEIMMSMLLEAMFISIMAGAFYMMLSYYTKTQQLQTARERGHRVIEYFDHRIRHAGLGLWDCGSSQKLQKLLENNGGVMAKNDTNLPVSLISSDNDNFKVEDKNAYCDKDGTFKGNIVTIAYAYRDFDASRKFILTANSPVSSSTITENRTLIDENGIGGAGFNKDTNDSNKYSVTEGTGWPLKIAANSSNVSNVKLQLEDGQGTVYAGSELLHFACERLFVSQDKSNSNLENSSFCFALPTKDDENKDAWSQAYHHVAGILGIHMEFNTRTKIFDLYVLSTGGKDSSRINATPPASWPKHAKWDSDKYAGQVLYISRASWKLNNIPKDFDFTYHATTTANP